MPREILKIFGNISHTLQDFYSHSNWVERQIYGTSGFHKTLYDYSQSQFVTGKDIGFYEELIHENFTYNKSEVKKTCDTTADTALDLDSGTEIILNKLTSGYYHRTPDIYEFHGINVNTFTYFESIIGQGTGADKVTYNAPFYQGWEFKEIIFPMGSPTPIFVYEDNPAVKTEKCQHGDKFNDFLPSQHFGIAKDQPFRKNHATARISATLATTHLIEAIISDVKDSEGENEFVDRAILLFLGHRLEATIKTEVNALHHGGCRTRNGGPGNAEDTNWQTCNVLSLQCEENASCDQLMSDNTLANSEVHSSKTASRNDLDEFCQDTQYLHSGFADAYAQLNGDALLRGFVKVDISAGSDFCGSSWSNSSARSELSDTITIVGGDIAPNPVLVLHFDVSSTLSPAKTKGWPSDTEVQFKRMINGNEPIICSSKKYQSVSLNDAGEVVTEITDEGEFSSEKCKVSLLPTHGRRTFGYALALQINALNSKGGTSSSIASVRLSKITFDDDVTTPESIGARLEFSSGISSPN